MSKSPMDTAVAVLDRHGAPPEAAREIMSSWAVMGFVNPDHDCRPPGLGRQRRYLERAHRSGPRRKNWARAWVCECGAVWQTYWACASGGCAIAWKRTGHTGACPDAQDQPAAPKKPWWRRW